MATYTSYLNLTKLSTGERLNWAAINENWDKIDAAMSTVNPKKGSISSLSSDNEILSYTPGAYMVALNAASDYLPTRYGTLVVSHGSGNYGVAIFASTAGNLYFRHMNATTGWHNSWTQVALQTAFSDFTYRTIAENTDLNTLTSQGFYACLTAAIAQTLTNCPVSGNFTMIVLKKGNYPSQFMVYGNYLFAREQTSSGYSAWYKYAGFTNDSAFMKRKVYTKTGITCTAGDPMSRAQQYSISNLNLTGYTLVSAILTRFSGSTATILPLVVVSSQNLYLNIHRVSGAAVTAEQEVDITVTWVRNELVQTFT